MSDDSDSDCGIVHIEYHRDGSTVRIEMRHRGNCCNKMKDLKKNTKSIGNEETLGKGGGCCEDGAKVFLNTKHKESKEKMKYAKADKPKPFDEDKCIECLPVLDMTNEKIHWHQGQANDKNGCTFGNWGSCNCDINCRSDYDARTVEKNEKCSCTMCKKFKKTKPKCSCNECKKILRKKDKCACNECTRNRHNRAQGNHSSKSKRHSKPDTVLNTCINGNTVNEIYGACCSCGCKGDKSVCCQKCHECEKPMMKVCFEERPTLHMYSCPYVTVGTVIDVANNIAPIFPCQRRVLHIVSEDR